MLLCWVICWSVWIFICLGFYFLLLSWKMILLFKACCVKVFDVKKVICKVFFQVCMKILFDSNAVICKSCCIICDTCRLLCIFPGSSPPPARPTKANSWLVCSYIQRNLIHCQEPAKKFNEGIEQKELAIAKEIREALGSGTLGRGA